MAKLQELISQVEDAALRARLSTTAEVLSSRISLGLNFERHIPEFVPLPGVPVRTGALVADRSGSFAEPRRVVRREGETASCRAMAANDASADESFACTDLVVVRRAGEPIYPALAHVQSVGGVGPGPHHVLIEGENHAVLQLLGWTHAGRVDCIYIDPPYNTGARDWRYNNDYVDRNDSFKSSKWLSMMERRLLMARRLLAADGVLIIAIDDYEYAHLVTLLASDRLFRGWTIETVVIQHNPRGGGGNHISNTHEYAVFVIPPGRGLAPINRGVDEIRDFRRRGRGDNNRRSGRPKSFFAIHVDPTSREVVGVGPEIGKDEPYETGFTEDGLLRIYPLGRDGLERVWRNTRIAVEGGIASGSLTLRCTANDTIVQVISAEKKIVPIRSVWGGPRYNAGEQGSNLVQALTGVEFPYPKSIYTVFDCLKAAVGDRPNALVLDFFGGSGTTTHATQLLNEADRGNRQAILVTNNEVGDGAERELRQQGRSPGDDAWESLGICRSVTFPRLANAFSGQRPDNTPIEWEFDIGLTREIEVDVEVTSLPFVAADKVHAPAARTALGRYLGVSAKALKDAWPFYVPPAEGSAKDRRAVLFDPEATNDFATALADAGEVERVFFVASGSARRDAEIAAIITEALGPRIEERPVVKTAASGLQGSLSYFRLTYLDPDAVEIGRMDGALLPTLWLMAGARGSVPPAFDGPMLVPADGRFAILADEGAFRDYREVLRERSDIEWLFIASDSEDGFQQLSADLPTNVPLRRRVHLHRDYLSHFRQPSAG